ncbi:MAG TPA: ATP-dependent DNA helicase RecG [Bacteroidia bacterium]|nr:ATP-dependent DNA helicase RecG [Bacteroidia bacterium]
MSSFFDTGIEFLKGVGPHKGETLKKELGIFTFGDLLFHFPFRYVDRTQFYKINQVVDDAAWVQIKGRLVSLRTIGAKRAMRMVGMFQDETGTVELVWFKGIKWLRDSLKPNADYILFGKPAWYGNKLNFPHPELELIAPVQKAVPVALQPFYNTTEACRAKGLDSKGILRLQKELWRNLPAVLPESLPEHLLQSLNMLPLREALSSIHFPSDTTNLKNAQFRLKFEELFYIQLELLVRKLINTKKYKGKVISSIGEHFNHFYQKHLPFALTNAQKRVLKEIRSDLGSGAQMNRLLQGDVGSGKTIVALMSMIMVYDNGFQACLMAPTEILALQHYNAVSQLLEGTGMEVGLLTGSTKNAERKVLLEKLADGSLPFVIGTHALIEDRVQFNNIGLVIIDEQHRFGVEQRAKLWKKDAAPPHILVMTATPIPRTLAMTLYGDLETSVIDELPPGRKPIRTEHRFESSRLRLVGFLKKEIAKGRQVYIVYPLIEESEKLDLMNLQQGYESVCRDFPLPDYRVSIVHGRMKSKDKDSEMQLFSSGKTHIMVATTVIEVGVNVPNASVMVIESAERFGLSQLHQLRGRVGRGADQSYCILMTGNKLSSEARLRMNTMVRTNDGFEIAEVDMQLRGHGDLAGTQQSGVVSLKIADLTRDGAILSVARNAAIEMLKNDPDLKAPANAIAAHILSAKRAGKKDMSRIS